MRKFSVLLKKEVRELLTRQFIIPVLAMLVLFAVIGKIAGRQKLNINEGGVVAVLDQDKSPASAMAIAALKDAHFDVDLLEVSDVGSAAILAQKNSKTALLALPKGFGDSIAGSKKARVEVYGVFRGLGLKSMLSTLEVKRAVKVINDAMSAKVAREQFPGLDAAFLKTPVAGEEYVVFGSRMAKASISDVTSFLQGQTKLVPMVIFLVIILAAQVVAMTVASEKENKTLETLLTAPVDRRAIVFAKLAAAAIVSFIFSGAYLIGMHSFMSGLTGQTGGGMAQAVAVSGAAASAAALGIVVTPLDFGLIGVSVLLGILCALSIALILGVLADDVKAVQAVTAPLMIVVSFSYIITLMLEFSTSPALLKWLVLAIPFSHPFLAMQYLMVGERVPVVGGIIYQFLVVVVFVWVAARVFAGDKVLSMRLRFGTRKRAV